MEQATIQSNTPQSPIIAPHIKYCLYARKSSETEERQILSIDSQVKEMLEIGQRDNLEVIEIKRESHSAKDSGQRPVFAQMLKEINEGKFGGILTWAPDRLSRNAGDLGCLVDLMDRKILHEIRTYGQKFANNPNEKFLLMILGSQAKLENDNKSVNVKRGLRTKVEMGLWPSVAPTGYLNEKRSDRKGYVTIDPYRSPVIKQMFEKVAREELSGRKLYQWLKDIRFKARSGKPLSLSNVYSIIKNPFYHGTFEFPKNSGNWYAGKHTPIITKELYDKVQEQLAKETHARINSKEFAFTRLLTCGLCGSGVTAEEKFKKLKDGSVNRHVYYGCTRSRDLNCKCGYIREEDLIKQLIDLLDKINLNKLGVKENLEEERKRYDKFRKAVLGLKEKDEQAVKEINIKNYARYVLTEGTILEKRELLYNLRSKLILKHKVVYLEI